MPIFYPRIVRIFRLPLAEFEKWTILRPYTGRNKSVGCNIIGKNRHIGRNMNSRMEIYIYIYLYIYILPGYVLFCPDGIMARLLANSYQNP